MTHTMLSAHYTDAVRPDRAAVFLINCRCGERMEAWTAFDADRQFRQHAAVGAAP